MTDTVNRINGGLDRAVGENCALEEVATECVQNGAQTTQIYTKTTQHHLLIFVP